MKRPRTFLLALVVMSFAGDIHGAAAYPDSLKMTCAQAKSYIANNDGAILATGDAYASFHSSYCSGQPAYVKTKDEQYCFVGQYCDCEMTYCAQSYFQGQ